MNEMSKDRKIVENFPYFFWMTVGYALFYVICLYKNGSGITYPFFTLGTIAYFVLCMKKMEVKVKSYSIFYMVCVELLGLSTCLTDSWVIIFLNQCSIFFLVIAFLLHNFYENKGWNFLEHIKAFLSAIFISFGFIYKPFSHFVEYKNSMVKTGEKNKNSKIVYVILGVVIALPLVAVVLALLISADAIFGEIFANIFKDFDFYNLFGDGILSSMLFVIIFFGAYMLISFLGNYRVNSVKMEGKMGEPVIAITITSILSFIYVIFCAIQVMYLFIGGSVGLKLPMDMTYAEYAREGFFQLLFVCIINLFLVLMGVYLFRESKVLKVLLCVITSCTYIMIVSSALRMILYIQYKYLTFLRVFVLWALLVIFILMVGVMINIFKENFNLFKYSTIVMTCLYLVLSFMRVDYIVAKVNVDNMSAETQYEFFKGADLYDDTSYLTYNLSLDAAPVVLNLIEEYESKESDLYFNYTDAYVIRTLKDKEDLGIRNFNVSRFIAYEYADYINEEYIQYKENVDDYYQYYDFW